MEYLYYSFIKFYQIKLLNGIPTKYMIKHNNRVNTYKLKFSFKMGITLLENESLNLSMTLCSAEEKWKKSEEKIVATKSCKSRSHSMATPVRKYISTLVESLKIKFISPVILYLPQWLFINLVQVTPHPWQNFSPSYKPGELFETTGTLNKDKWN